VSVTRIDVGGERPYQVVVGTGVLGELPALVGGKARTVVVISPESLAPVVHPVCGVLAAAGYLVRAETVPAGEAAKEIGVAARLWSRLAVHGVTRSDAIVGVGGGATTDLAGFVAATWLRGVRLVLVPTTLLAITDAAVGGKTAINTADGKNLVGAFYPPAGVLADLAVLESLPAGEYASGMAEVIKAGFIADPVILDLIEADPAGAMVPHGRHARELVERAVRMKAEVSPAISGRPGDGRSSTTVTPSATPSNSWSTTGSGTGRRSRWAWCTRRNWAGWRAGSTRPRCTGTGGS
jgi:3-dehydroquinate synthase